MSRTSNRLLAATTLGAAVLAGCSSNGGTGEFDPGSVSTGDFELGVTDAPVDGAANVFVQFSGVELQPAGGQRIVVEYDEPRQIDLLALQGASRELLLASELPAGRYEFIRLQVDAELDTLDSYIVFEDGSEVSLFVPGGDRSGLQLNGDIEIGVDGLAAYTVDFDLRKSIKNPQGRPDYTLRPTLRLVRDEDIGHIAGSVSPALINGAECTNDVAADTGHAVYLYAGADATVDDLGSPDEPLSSGLVTLDPASGAYRYEIGFLNEGAYTLAFTCQASDDSPELDEDISFSATLNASVTAGATTTADF